MDLADAPPDARPRPAASAALGALARRFVLPAGRALLDVVYPPACVACRAATAEAGALCPACWGGVRFVAPPYCDRLATPFPYDVGARVVSPAAVADPPVFARARAAVVHEGVGRDLVHRLKYADRADLAPLLGGLIARAGADVLAEAEVIVPVPLHWTRRWARRFNQADLLAAEVARLSGKPLASRALARVKRTRQQVGLSRNERRAALQGAFRVPDARRLEVAGRRVALVDDVLTTASTGNACARALLRAGASGVDLLVFARVTDAGG